MTQPLRTVDLLPIPSTQGAEPQSRGLGGLLALSAGAERAFPLLGVKVRASIAAIRGKPVERALETTTPRPRDK